MNSDAKLFTSNSFDETDANPPHSPGRLGYRSIPSAVQRPSSNDEDLLPDSVLHDNSSDVFQREDSATSLHSNESNESSDSKKNISNHLENSPSITSSGYHSDEIHTNDAVTVNGVNNSHRVLDESTIPTSPSTSTLTASPSASTSSVSTYDATRYEDKTSSETTLPTAVS